ncbi:MAG: hypothetical protein WCL04_04600 [Verrucomicrobiota bacterium]
MPLLLALVAFTATAACAQDPIKVGEVASLTGKYGHSAAARFATWKRGGW